MKTIKLYLITCLFLIAFEACNHNVKNDSTDNTISPEGLDKPFVKNTKDSTTHNDTIITPADDDNSMNKNNPDITK